MNKIRSFLLMLKEEERSENTLEKYERDVKKFIEFLDGREITKNEVLEFKRCLIERYKVRSVNSMLAAVNMYLKFLKKYDCTVKRLKIQMEVFRSEDKELTFEEYERLLNAAKKINDEQLIMILQTICSTGIRVSELQNFCVEKLKHGSFDVKNKGKVRTIVIPSKLLRELKRFCAKYKILSGPIFITKKNKPIDRKMIWLRMKNLCLLAKVDAKKVFPHNLRRLFAKTFYKVQKDIVGLSALFGHTNVNTTHIYLMPTMKSCQKILNSMSLVIRAVT